MTTEPASSGQDVGRPADKGTAILEAALALFVRNGFHATRVEEIAERAGVAKGTVYEYFASKEDLFKGVLSLSLERYGAAVQEAVGRHERAAAQLTALIEASLALAREHRPLARMVLGAMSSMHEHLQEHVLSTLTQVRQVFRQVIEAGIRAGEFRPLDPLLASGAVMGAVKGLIRQWLFGEPAHDPAAAAAQVCDLLLRGLAASGGTEGTVTAPSRQR